MLSVEKLNAYYGKVKVLHDVSFEIKRGEMVALLGRNGAGKTTLLKCIVGILKDKTGKIMLDDTDISTLPPHKVIQLGIGYVPQLNVIFPDLTVYENLKVGIKGPLTERHLETAFALFPRLKEMLDRPARTLSGGEQQMLNLARVLIRRPKLLLLDEPYEGLMPGLARRLTQYLKNLSRGGVPVLITGGRIEEWIQECNKAILIDQGVIVHSGPAKEILNNRELITKTLGAARYT